MPNPVTYTGASMSLLEQRASRNLRELAQSLRQYTDGADGSDTFPTAIQGLSILRSDQANRPASCLFRPALYMTLQGAKWATFEEKRYKFGARQSLMVAVDIPSRGTVVVASSKTPYLGLQIGLDFSIASTAVSSELRLCGILRTSACRGFRQQQNHN